VQTAEAFGVIGEAGIGGGIVTNGRDCAMLGSSVADADLETVGEPGADWEATRCRADSRSATALSRRRRGCRPRGRRRGEIHDRLHRVQAVTVWNAAAVW
jgi:hypothetical protein